MSLTNEDKKVLPKLHLEKAHSCLNDGEQLLAIDSISPRAAAAAAMSTRLLG